MSTNFMGDLRILSLNIPPPPFMCSNVTHTNVLLAFSSKHPNTLANLRYGVQENAMKAKGVGGKGM